MGNFNLNKSKDEGKEGRFRLTKGGNEPTPAVEKKDRFSLNKSSETAPKSEKTDKFNLNKGKGSPNAAPGKSVVENPKAGNDKKAIENKSEGGKGQVNIGSTQKTDNTSGNTTKKKSNVWWIILLIVVAVVLLLILLLNKKPTNSVNDSESEPANEVVDNQIDVNENGSDAIFSDDASQAAATSGLVEDAKGVAASENTQGSSPQQMTSSQKSTTQGVTKPVATQGVGKQSSPVASDKSATSKTVSDNQTMSNTKRTQNQAMNNAPDVATGNIDELARFVIRGAYGNGAERRNALGDRYAEIQKRVNEMYRNREL